MSKKQKMIKVNRISSKVYKITFAVLLAIVFLLIYFLVFVDIEVEKSEQNNTENANIELILERNHLLKSDEVNLDKELQIWDLAEKDTNLALNYYNQWKKYPHEDWTEQGFDTCDTEIPGFQDIDFNNIFWQTIPNTNKTQYFFYNAYYDNRGDQKYVRVVGTERDPSSDSLWSVQISSFA